MVGIGFKKATARSGKTFGKMENNSKFERNIDGHGKCKSVPGYESGKFKEEGMGRQLLTSYHLWYARGAVAYFIFKAFQSLYPEMGIGTTLFVYKDGGKI